MITTAGLTALGAASLAPVFAQEVSQKPWAVGATLRGFYDDNIYTYSKKLQNTIPGFQADSWGFSVAPDAAYNLKTDQTTLGVSYIYTMTYFVDRPRPRDDQSHQASMKLSHAFSERYRMDVSDSFASAQEPSILDPSVGIATPIRTPGTNNRNLGRINFEGDFSEKFGVDLAYNNTVYDYEEDASGVPGGIGSRSAVLDRMEHLISFDGNYMVAAKTKLSLGYQYGVIDYTSQDLFTAGVRGTQRDSDSHFVSVGVRHDLNAQIVLSGKVGVQITEYENKQLFGNDQISPYADVSARWQYSEGSSAQLTVRHLRMATDVRSDQAGRLVADAEVSSVMLSVSHAITPKIRLDGSAMYQHSDFNSGGSSAADELFFGSLMATYQFNPFIAVEAGYMFDRLDSDLLSGFRSYTRNRVFIGTRLTY